ncbi:MAG: hypothetical protein AB9891_21815 [Anaerolineaceae bacterium]
MDEFLRFLEKYEAWFYIISGGLALIFIKKMLSAWSELRNAVFGLERELANRRFISAMTVIILIILFTGTEFVLVSFIAPGIPDIQPLATPTISLETAPILATPETDGTQLAPQSTASALVTQAANTEGCEPGKIEWQSPTAGEEISGTVKLEGTVNPDNFGFYKYEFSQAGSESWTTIAAGNEKHVEGELGTWSTGDMPQGDYLIRLVVVDNQNQPYPACVLPVTITAP